MVPLAKQWRTKLRRQNYLFCPLFRIANISFNINFFTIGFFEIVSSILDALLELLLPFDFNRRNTACHFNTVDLAKHSSPYASFNLESVSITILSRPAQCFITTYFSALMSMFFTEKNEKKPNSEIKHWLHYAIKTHTIQRRLFTTGLNDTYVSPLSAGMVHNSSSGHYSI